MVNPYILACAVSLLGLSACRHDPPSDPSEVPTVAATPAPSSMGASSEEPASKPATAGLAQPCDDATPCRDGLRCRHPCGDTIGEYEPDACEPSGVAFCDAEPNKRSLASEELMLVLSAGGVYGVLAAIEDPDLLTAGTVEALAVNDVAIVVGRRAPKSVVPATARALVGRSLSVMGARGQVCEAEVAGFSLIGLEPRDGSPLEDRDRVKVGASVDEKVLFYARQNGAVYLAANLEAADGDCSGALWARASDLPMPPYSSGREAKGPARAAAFAAYGELIPYQANVARLKVEEGESAPSDWTTYREGGGFGPLAVEFDLAERHHVVVSTRVGHVCVGFATALMASFHAEPEALDLGALSWTFALRPRIALDLDGDSELELIAHDGMSALLWSPTLTIPGGFATASATTGC